MVFSDWMRNFEGLSRVRRENEGLKRDYEEIARKLAEIQREKAVISLKIKVLAEIFEGNASFQRGIREESDCAGKSEEFFLVFC